MLDGIVHWQHILKSIGPALRPIPIATHASQMHAVADSFFSTAVQVKTSW